MVAINTSATQRISISNSLLPDATTSATSMSTDGRFVVFRSFSNVFLRDTLTGSTVTISQGLDGLGNAASSGGYLSGEGRFALFSSEADNLVSGDTNGSQDVFLRDLWTGVTLLLSVGVGGSQASSGGTALGLSADGRFALFASSSNDLVTGDTNGQTDIFRKDLFTGVISRVSVDSSGIQANGQTDDASISADGDYVAFRSFSTNLVGDDTNNRTDIFIRDIDSGITERVSISSSGEQSNGHSFGPALSADGRFVAFSSIATNLVTGDTNGARDVFLRDLENGITTRVSVSTGSQGGNADSNRVDVSGDGRFVVFESAASNLVAGDTNGVSDIFLRDTILNTTTRLSVGLAGVEANGASVAAKISDDGQSVTFRSSASNLTAGDTNGTIDVFRVSLVATSGADWLIGSDGSDSIASGDGSDIVTGGRGDDTIDGGAGHDVLDGGTGHDKLTGGIGNDELDGGNGNDVLADGGGNNVLNGGLGLDILISGSGRDTLDGGDGNDTLTGFGGKDFFVFSSALGASNVDKITDFNTADDTIRLDDAIFTALTVGTLHTSAFKDNFLSPRDADDTVVYNSSTGSLFYDADGLGGAAAVKVASLSTGLALTAADFVVL